MSYDKAITRRLYWYSTCISAVGPFLGYWVMDIWYLAEAAINGYRFYGKDGSTFITVKILLSFVYSVFTLIITYEFMWPILDWWQKLETLVAV